MALRRRRYRRRVLRRRVRRGRVHRNRFSFGSVRAFKIKNVLTINVVAVTVGTSTLYMTNAAITDLPQAGYYLWNQLRTAFDWYRTAAMKLTFIPSNTAMVGSIYQSGIVFHDPNSTTFPITATDNDLRAISYTNSKFINFQRRWKYYKKMVRTLVVGLSTTGQAQDRRGFISTEQSMPTQIIGLISSGWPTPGTPPAPPQYPYYLGDLYITYYVLFKGPRSLSTTCT